jgi:hypothetical protein
VVSVQAGGDEEAEGRAGRMAGGGSDSGRATLPTAGAGVGFSFGVQVGRGET